MADADRDHFALFGLTRAYDLDETALRERYRQLQRVVHPDRFAGASDQERRLAMQEAVRVNEAFETLKDPLRRAIYLLSLQGIELDEDKTAMDPGFLMELMDLREALEAVPDAGDPYATLDEVLARIQGGIEEIQGRLAETFAQADAGALEEAADLVRRYQFLDKLAQEAERVEAELEA